MFYLKSYHISCLFSKLVEPTDTKCCVMLHRTIAFSITLMPCKGRFMFYVCATSGIAAKTLRLCFHAKHSLRPHLHVKVMAIIKYQQNECTMVILQFLQQKLLPHHAGGMVQYKPGIAIGSTEGRVSTRKKAYVEENA